MDYFLCAKDFEYVKRQLVRSWAHANRNPRIKKLSIPNFWAIEKGSQSQAAESES